MTRLPHVTRVAAGLALATIVLTSCSLGDRQARADAIHDSVVDQLETGRLAGSMSFTLARMDMGVSIAGAAASDLEVPGMPSSQDRRPRRLTASFVIDDANHAASTLVQPPVPGTEPFALVYRDDRMFLKRPEAKPDEARPWYELHYDDLEEGSGELTMEMMQGPIPVILPVVLDPRFLIDLAATPLAGSIKTKTAGSATKYAANFDIPSIFDETRSDAYTEERQDSQELVLSLLKITRDVHPGDVVLDSNGRLQRFHVELKVSMSKLVSFVLDISVVLDGKTAGPVVPPPDRESTTLIDSLIPIERSVASMLPTTTTQQDFGG